MRQTRRKALAPALLLMLAGAAGAQTPDDFAWQWPIATAGDDGAHTLMLDESVYARITRQDLGDLVVFNADGQPVPFASLPQATTREEERRALNWMRVAAEDVGADGDRFSLRLERDADGTVRDLQIQSDGSGAAAASSDLLVDLGERPVSVSALKLTLADDARLPVNLRVQVLASDDLTHWRELGGDLAFVAMVDNGLRIERLRLEFAGSSERFLRLALAPGGDWPALARIESEHVHTGVQRPERREVALAGEAVAGEPGVFRYRVPGPLPVERFDLDLATGNTVAQATVESRDGDGDDLPWSGVESLTLFRLGSGAGEVRQLAADIGANRDRHWRVRTTPALAQAPTLRLAYRPDRFVLLAQEPAPYRLFAGSVRAQRADYPVQAALAAAAASKPPGWEPPLATLGAGSAAAGDVALQPDRGPDYRRWALWAVLAIGGLVVLAMSLRVLRHPPPEA